MVNYQYVTHLVNLPVEDALSITMTTWSNNTKGYSSVTNGATDREAYPRRRIAALVQICTERKVGERLNKINIENYVPIHQEIHQWSDRKKKINRVVIPMVVFIHTDENTEKQIKRFSFIHKILSYPGCKDTAIIPDEQIERLKFMLNHSDTEVLLNERFFSVGETVRIARGPLKGLEGELCHVIENRPLVAIRIECFGYACVSISKSDIESIKN